VAVVGSELTRDVRVVARAIGALGEMAVHMLSVSASGTNVTAVIDAADLERAMRQMHAALFEGSESGAGIGAAAALAHATR
jgi:aspartate kinase